MTRSGSISLVLLAVLASAAAAQTSSNLVTDPNTGITYQETRTTVPRTIYETRMEERRYVSYRDQYTTDVQEVPRTYSVPITEQQWVPGWQRTWNIFAPPVVSYRLMPVTRWETRQEVAKVPVTRYERIPQEQVSQVQVSSPRVVQGEIIQRMPVSGRVESGIASQPGGQKLSSDPPRNGTTGTASRYNSSTEGWVPQR